MRVTVRIGFAVFGAVAAYGQILPDGPGRMETEKLCKGCHEISRSIAPRQDRAGWNNTMQKMVAYGLKSSEADYNAVLAYLSTHYPAEEVGKINVNTASAIDMESGLTLRRSQAHAVIEWREKNGAFHSLDDLKKVPGIDAAKLDEKADRITFE
jgi:competence protein ComEA